MWEHTLASGSSFIFVRHCPERCACTAIFQRTCYTMLLVFPLSGTFGPNLIQVEYEEPVPVYMDIGVILPLVISLLAVVALSAGVYICLRRSKSQQLCNQFIHSLSVSAIKVGIQVWIITTFVCLLVCVSSNLAYHAVVCTVKKKLTRAHVMLLFYVEMNTRSVTQFLMQMECFMFIYTLS